MEQANAKCGQPNATFKKKALITEGLFPKRPNGGNRSGQETRDARLDSNSQAKRRKFFSNVKDHKVSKYVASFVAIPLSTCKSKMSVARC
jgi:hypothetical protein